MKLLKFILFTSLLSLQTLPMEQEARKETISFKYVKFIKNHSVILLLSGVLITGTLLILNRNFIAKFLEQLIDKKRKKTKPQIALTKSKENFYPRKQQLKIKKQAADFTENINIQTRGTQKATKESVENYWKLERFFNPSIRYPFLEQEIKEKINLDINIRTFSQDSKKYLKLLYEIIEATNISTLEKENLFEKVIKITRYGVFYDRDFFGIYTSFERKCGFCMFLATQRSLIEHTKILFKIAVKNNSIKIAKLILEIYKDYKVDLRFFFLETLKSWPKYTFNELDTVLQIIEEELHSEGLLLFFNIIFFQIDFHYQTIIKILNMTKVEKTNSMKTNKLEKIMKFIGGYKNYKKSEDKIKCLRNIINSKDLEDKMKSNLIYVLFNFAACKKNNKLAEKIYDCVSKKALYFLKPLYVECVTNNSPGAERIIELTDNKNTRNEKLELFDELEILNH